MESDKKIIKKVLSGDVDTFDKLVDRYGSLVGKLCLGFMKNREDAMDMAQEVFIKIYNNLDKFQGNCSLSTWIYRICANTCLTQLKKQHKIAICNIDSINTVDFQNPEDILVMKEVKGLIEDEIRNLNESNKKIMLLRILDMTKFKDIALRLGLQGSTVRSSFTRARKHLQERINCYYKE